MAQRTTGPNAAVVNTLQYDSFGKLISQSNASKQPYHGFAGRDIEPVGGLTYNRNRYYSTQTGRFISQDPIGFNAGDENLYRYVGNSPTNATDPSGLWEKPVGTFPEKFEDLTMDQITGLVGDKVFILKTNIGGSLVQGKTTENVVWFIPMLGVNANGDVIQKGTFVFDDYESARSQARKNHELRWIAAAGQVLRDVAGTAELGTLPGATQSVSKNIQALAERRAAAAAAKQASEALAKKEAAKEAKEAAEAAAKNAPVRPVVSILERDGNVILGEINMGGSKLQFLANESIQGKTLILDKLHIQEAGGTRIMNEVGRQSLIDAARVYGKQCGVEEVIIQGGARASKTVTTPTGKVIVKPARVPEPIRIRVGE